MNEDEVMVYDDATWGRTGQGIVPSRQYQVYRVPGPWLADDESAWYEFDSEEKSEVTIDPEYSNYASNKYGKTEYMEVVNVTVTPNETLKTQYPNAQVKIDGKFYDLGILDNPVEFVMSKDHKISIIWSPAELVESFRVVRLK